MSRALGGFVRLARAVVAAAWASACAPASLPAPAAVPAAPAEETISCANASTRRAPDASTLAGRRVMLVCFEGNVESTPTSLRRFIQSTEGAPFDAATVAGDIERLYASGKIDDVRAAVVEGNGGVVLILGVTERPAVVSLRFEGAHALSEEEVRTAFGAGALVALDPARLKRSTQKLVAEYFEQGYRHATATPRAVRGATGADVVVAIDEGPQVKLSSMVFTGAKAIPQAEIERLATSKIGDVFHASWFERDLLVISAAYYDRGMLGVQVGVAEIVPSTDHKTVAVRVPVTEGPVFRLGKIELRGVPKGRDKEYRAFVRVKRGDVFDRSKLLTIIGAMRGRLLEQRETQGIVEPAIELDPKKGVCDLTLVIQ